MSDHTNLPKQLREFGSYNVMCEAADALEALEARLAEAEALRKDAERWRHEWQRECEQTDLLLQGLGLCPSEYRSDGGSLLLGRIKHKVGNIMLDNERLRELLREALPAVASYIRKNERAQQAAERRDDVNMVDKHASMVRHYSRIKSDIDAALPSDQPAHQWREAHGPIKWPHCQVCGVIQRSDEQNGSCKGPVAITTRTDQPTACVKDGGECGLGGYCDEHQPGAVRKHTPECSYWDGLMAQVCNCGATGHTSVKALTSASADGPKGEK